MDDLPIIGQTVRTTSLAQLTEAIGTAPDSERVVHSFSMLAHDEHTASKYAHVNGALTRNSDGTPSYSCERWVRLRFTPPFGVLANVRFWIDNYAPNPGWELLWGTSPVYLPPSLDASTIAVYEVPTSDPGVSNLGMDIITGGTVQYSPWVIFQARWDGVTPGPIQTDSFNFDFGWSES